MFACISASAYAQTDTIRYVHPNGAYNNDGKSWGTAFNRVQDAINSLRDYLQEYSLHSGSVYIAAGNYIPTESTESSGGSILNTSFKIYGGIHVYGGFNPDAPEEKPGDRIMSNGKKCSENWADPSGIGTVSATEIASQWDLKHKTVLSGNHTTTPPSFVFDSIRGRYNTTFPASSFHVVWFATNGKFDFSEGLADHFRPLADSASVDGCVISSGNASTKNTNVREHTAFGGGVYMVGRSGLRNCIVERCNATMRGGGIYTDGGGTIEFCLIKMCQSAGVGVYQGYGGGVCIDHGGSIGHSHITSCAARCGGGLLISHVPEEYPTTGVEALDTISNYNPFATACVINNNTANAEGGGIYLAEGGTVNHCTVTANCCTGADVTYYGRRHGRSGGIYVRNCGMIFNSVFWGNRCDVNNDIQFASVRQKSGIAGYETLCFHTAFMNHDITDWTGVKKEMVFTLEKQNLPYKGSVGNHPCFFNPTVDPENWSRFDTVGGKLIMGAGVLSHIRAVDYPGPRIWHLTSYSALDQKGLQANETVRGVSYWLHHAHTDYGVVTNPYEPVATLGALVRRSDPLAYALIPEQGYEGRREGGGALIPTLFIDPNRQGVYDEDGHFVEQSKEGNSWDTPIKDMGEAISFFRQYLVDDDGGNHHYMIPALDRDDMPTGEPTRYDYIQFLVKEGTITTVGHGNYLDKNIRTAAIRLDSHMRLYGGYPSSLTGTDTSERDPRAYKSIISANITGIEGASGYQNNSAHVVTMVNVEHTIVDGFTLTGANTHNVYESNSASAGGGLLMNNNSTPAEKRIHMVGNQLRNCVISNCTSPKGAAVYVNGEFANSEGELSYAELMMQNCVIRNNTADYLLGPPAVEHGIITANGRAYIHIEHCTIVNNVGYPFKADNKTTESDAGTIFHGYIRVDNSLIFCNGDRVLDNRGKLGEVAKVMSVNEDGQDYVFGKWNMFDADLRLHKLDVHQPRGFFADGYTVPITDHFMPDGVISHFTEDIAAVPADSLTRGNRAIFTRVNSDANYPTFVNPARNVGHSETGDKPLYGGKVAYDPLTTNPCVNAAHPDDYTEADNYDRSDNLLRDRGGAPDIGAVENEDLPAAGTVIYVTPDGAGKRDGSSWDNAIAGNTVYQLSTVPGPDLATGDQIDPELTCDRVLDSEGNPILTTDEKYNGGFGRVWFTAKTQSVTTTLTTHATISETNTYTGGGPSDGVVTPDPYEDISSVVTPVSSGAVPGFVPGYDNDPRYPYGEISGASRTFWRANPYTGNSGSYNINTFIAGCKANGWINNTRAERYVGGLQYAVEKASTANKTAHSDSVQVWVGAGIYTDYKGFVMRDSVTVLGGFPAGKFKAPALSERQALMTNVINIPKSKPAANFNAEDYETILQISEEDPNKAGDHKTLNPDAVKYWDNDYSLDEISDTEIIETATITRTNTYTWQTATTDVSSTYIRYADMLYGGNLVFHKNYRRKIDREGNTVSKNITMGNEEFCGINWTAGQLVVYQYFGPAKSASAPWPDANGNKSWELAYEDRSNNINYDVWGFNSNRDVLNAAGTKVGSAPRGMNLEGVMNTMSFGQTMKNVPAGDYQLQIDLGAYYHNYPDDSSTGITFYIITSDGTTVATQSVYCKSDKLRRYEFSFTQPADGDLTIRLLSTPGSHATDPATGSLGSNGDKTKANYRRICMSNVLLKQVVGTDYVLTDHNDVKDITDTSEPIPHTNYVFTAQTERSTLRKRVLTMPDVCVPTYGGGGIGDPVSMDATFGDNLAHTDRVWGPTKDLRTASTVAKQEDSHYVEYNEANWDGFTIRHGFIYNESMSHGGGAGVAMYEGGHLRNCIVINNMAASRNMKGGGMFCDGATSTIEGCFVLNNTSTYGTYKDKQEQIFAGGMFMYEGTCFNSLFANNYSYGSAGGLGFCVGRFFNNTIAYNTATLKESGQISGGAISLATSSNPNLFVANTIIFGNNGIAIRDRNAGVAKVNPFLYCYIQSEVAQPNATTKDNVNNWSESATSQYGTGNTFMNDVAPSAANTPFAADFDESGNYVAGRAASLNDFRLRDDVPCVNKGTEAFAGEFFTALRHKGQSENAIRNSFVYKSVEAAEMPDNDVAFARRVQDCQIDMGAYEFNAAFRIRPDTTTHPGHAIFYVAYASPGGDASSSSRDNAACAQKLQQVLDAAGRYKYTIMTSPYYNKGTAGSYVKDQPNKHWTVEVWIEGDSAMSTVSDSYQNFYTPTRSTKFSIPNYHDNTLDYSFIIPHGVQVKGGYKPNYYHYENAAGEEVAEGTEGAHIVDDRDPLTWRTVFSGFVTSSTGASGQTFHVVTFTNNLYDTDERLYMDTINGTEVPILGQLEFMTAEKDRAIIDGLFIEDGYANSPDPEDQIGGGAVVPAFAHVRNCVIQDNEALENGGGLYLKPYALVSGTIIKKNTAKIGGGIYIEAPESHNVDSLAHIFSTTICHNTATASAGGMWFDNTYARVNSTVLWHNMASDNANVSGLFTRSDENTEYPFNFCAVESRRLEGQGNLEISPTETEGVRWDREDPFNDILYYPIEMSSTLARAGMTYNEWYKNMRTYTTLDTIDIAGVSRTKWTSPGTNVPRGYAWGTDTLVTKNNDMIEIGARALNKTFAINVDQKYVMHRLYVMHTDLINSEAARALQDNQLNNDTANMYRQMGSCILNPFHRPGDAFDYIIAARKAEPAKYRNTVFSVFIEAGTYYPYHNAYGEQDEVRNNTFLVPEGIYVIGGVDSRPDNHHYGQEGYYDLFTGAGYGDPTRSVDVRVELPGGVKKSYTINAATLDEIRLRDATHRPMRDNNLNSVIEPWELERQTIFSGNAVSGEDFTHVYHVVTMHADSNYVGPQPLKFTAMNPERLAGDSTKPLLINPLPMNRPELFYQEIDLSILGRTTEFDGIQFTGGYANHLDPADTVQHHYVKKTYFRGGGIFVDGNWTESFDNPGDELPNVTEPAAYNIPIVVENCLFTNNMAGNGGGLYSNGGIYMYGCRFTQNYSQGPMTELDQKFIPWTAGGCIATNAVCDVSNTLFDNNEARRGMWPIIANSEHENIPDADARQGFGGVLSVAHQSRLRAVNCHFMRNKAVAYPSIYNFWANNRYSDPDSMQLAFNCIFWGNEVFEVEHLGDIYADDQPVPSASESAFETKYKNSRSGVFHYDPTQWKNYERLLHEYDSTYAYWTAESRKDTFNTAVTSKLAELRALGDKIEGLYFCSYRKGYGPSAMKPSAEGYLLTEAEQRAFTDPRGKNVKMKGAGISRSEDYTDLFSYVKGNNNVLINRLNTATDGPNFKQPSFVAGIDGYMQNADWLLARMNLTTDQGWGHLKQTVERGISYWITKYTGTKRFDTQEEAWTFIRDTVGADPADVYPVRGLPEASFASLQPDTAIYNYYSYHYGSFMSKVNAPLPLGDQYYMAYTRATSDTEISGNMDRISKNPKFGVEDVYIDIGIYEYQYVQLDIKGQEIDTMWVATKAKDPLRQDGLTWETPTTDLQTAIDMLMASHNNHDKYICFLGDKEGTFSPQNVIDNRRAFIITSNTLAPIMPDSAKSDFDYGINSLNFLGGYSYDVKNVARNPQENPVVIEMPNIGSEAQRNQLFIIEDMTRQMVQVNWQGEYTSRDSVVIPVTFDGITFINPYSTKGAVEEGLNNLGGLMSKKGGAAIYYRWQRRYEGTGGVWSPNFNFALHPDSALIDGNKMTLPKLTISNCIFMDNGSRNTAVHAERSPAVRIDHGGGSSLIVNSLFHSNAGAAIYAKTFDPVQGENDLARVPNDVIIMNSTFALNDGHIRLESDDSEIHNSLIWLDDLDNDTTVQLQMGTEQWDKTTNKNREGITGRMTHNAVWGCFQNHGAKDDDGDTYKNHPLATDNNDIFGGPGFVLPNVHATTSDQRRERSFRLNPSLRTVGMADSTVYKNRVFYRVYPDTSATTHGKYWRRPNGFKWLTITALANDSDLAAKPRLSGPGLDRGAYECLAELQRVLYVQPDMASFSAGDGSNWEKPFGQGQLQNAIDAAAVYTYLAYGEDKRESRKAYVFIKGTYDSQEPLNIHARDGVFVYGSLPKAFNDTATKADGKFSDAECQRYVNYVRAYSSGVASPNAFPTRVHSIHIEGDDFKTGSLFDGFEITNTTPRTEPALIIDNEFSAVRNCVIKNTKVKDTVVAVVNRGLLYNCLFYNDSAKAIVELKAGGLALNNTIVTDNAAVTPLDVTAATSGASKNNIALNTATDDLRPFAPYFTDKVPYSAPDYLSLYKPLSFQLHEHSELINAGTADNALPALFNSYVNDSTIAFRYDRDVLGNPRKIGAAVDLGALETWRVEKKTAQKLTSKTNKLGGDAPIEQVKQRFDAYLENYGGHKYPHEGSVVYLMDSSAMTIGEGKDPDEFKNIKNSPLVFHPGFMLLKPGASFFGNGHTVQLNYLAAEKRFKDQRFSMTAFPFNYTTANITVTDYDTENDSLTFNLSPFTFTTYQYNGAARSAKDYVFQTENSTLWRPVDTLNRTATEGYLMDFGANTDTVLRFTAFADEPSKNVYTENAEDKNVYLQQYDNRTAGTGADLNFTTQENMGWNMKGLPWLVSDYRTDTILWEGNFLRQMYIPHVLYQMDGAGEYIKARDQIYTSRSWDRGSTLSMGNAFLTQTATTKDRETVLFSLPYYESAKDPLSRPLLMISNNRQQTDLITVIADSSASHNIQYTYGRDGLKWIANDSIAQIYLLDSKRLSRISLLGAAPTETDIPLGVYAPADETFTFSLPEKEAFADYAYVWFIDYARNRYINLLHEDYEVALERGVYNNRFALRIGGYPKTDDKGARQYVVYAHGGTLFVRGLIPGDKITVYAPTGHLIYQAIASGTEWTLPLYYQNGYIVKVNDRPYKVLNL